MRMMWLFVVMGVSLALAAGALLAMYLRVRRQMRSSPPSEDHASKPKKLVRQEE